MNLLWKNDVVILVREMENTQSWIHVDPDRNRFVVTLRGSELKECIKLLDYIIKQVKEVTGERFPVMKCEEKVRSPHFEGCELDLETDVAPDLSLALNERKLPRDPAPDSCRGPAAEGCPPHHDACRSVPLVGFSLSPGCRWRQ